MSITKRLTLLTMAGVGLALFAAACGEDETGSSGGTPGNGVDRAFAAAMTPHHRSAVEMAEIARQQSQRSEIKRLADTIVATQNAEIEKLTALESAAEERGGRGG